MSVLKIKSNLTSESPGNMTIYDLVSEISNKEPNVTAEYDNISNQYRAVFEIDSDDSEFIQMIAKSINKHRYQPIDQYSSILGTDFTISISTNNIEDERCITDINTMYMQDQIMILGKYINTHIKMIENLKSENDALYDFIKSSGLLKYKGVNEYIVKKLDEKRILDKELIEDFVQPTTLH